MPNNDDDDDNGDVNGIFCVSVAVPQSMKLCTKQIEMENEFKMRKIMSN